MNLDDSDLMRLEKAAYGLAGAPRARFMRLCRELAAADQIPVCVSLVEVCGVHVDDLISGGTRESDGSSSSNLRKQLPFGDFRTHTIRYTGIETRQNPQTFAIEICPESYIDALEKVPTKQYGTASTPLKDAWPACMGCYCNTSRPILPCAFPSRISGQR